MKNRKKSGKNYRPIPFWSWNDSLEAEELKKQIQWMHESGIGGFFMHARSGLKTSYLSDEWMNCIDVCCEEAERLGMDAWIYDENGWPSGFVGGKLLEDEENRDMYIVHQIGKFDAQADISYRMDTNRIVRTDCEEKDAEYLNLYLHHSVSTVDILNPRVVERFLEETHEKYKAHFGEKFSSMIKGFFTDEPQYYRWETSYSEMIKAYFTEQYGEDLFDSLGLLFVEKEGYRAFRYKYWLAMQKLMLENFAKKIYDWCDANGVQLTGHYVEERSLGGQVLCCGGVMPFYEYEHIPGIDWLGSDMNSSLSLRQLGSAAAQLGKGQTITESFGCCGWDTTPGELKKIAGFQYVNGVNTLCHHLIPYSEYGHRKNDHPPHFQKINPWVKEHFQAFNQYLTELGTIVAESEEFVNVAILHPIRSAYFDFKQHGEGFGTLAFERGIEETISQFSSRGIAYHFLDETLLEEYGFVEADSIGCGECKYQYLVIPKCTLTMGKATEQLISTFVSNGGRILIMGEKPSYLEGELYEYSYLESNCTLEEIVTAQPFYVEHVDTQLYYTYRIWKGRPVLIVQNASSEQSFTQTFSFQDGSNAFEVLDLSSRDRRKVPLTLTLYENDTAVLFPIKADEPEGKDSQAYYLKFEDATVSFEENYFVIDAVRYSKDGTNYSEPILVNCLFRQLLEERYRGMLWLKYDFFVQEVPSKVVILKERSNAASHTINGIEFRFNKTYEDEPCMQEAEITALVQQGMNSYEIALDWYQNENVYYTLFGENVTESLKNCLVYDTEIEAIYLVGKFGVYSEEAFEPIDEEHVCGHGFYIGEVPQKVSEPVLEGLPFTRGKFTLQQQIALSDKNVLLYVEGRYLTAKVWVNSQYVGELLYGRRIDISDYSLVGKNDIKVEFTVGNRNLFGPFHSNTAEIYISPAMFEECTLSGYKLKRFYKEGK